MPHEPVGRCELAAVHEDVRPALVEAEAEHGLAEGDGPFPRLEGLAGDLGLPPVVHLLQLPSSEFKILR